MRFNLTLFFVVLFFASISQATSVDDKPLDSVAQILITIEQSIGSDIIYSQELIALANKKLKNTPNTAQLAKLSNLTGYVDILLGDYDSAYQNIISGKKNALRAGNLYEQAEALRLEAVLYSLTNLSEESLSLFLDALTIHKKLKSNKVLHTLQGISLYYRSIHAYEQYLEYGQLMRQHPSTKFNLKFKGGAEYTIGEALLKLGKYKVAKPHLILSANLMEKASSVWVSEAYISLAELALMTGDPIKALNILKTSKRIAKEKNYSAAQVQTDLLEARIYQASQDKTMAILTLKSLLANTRRDKNQSGERQAHQMLANLFEQQGELKLALYHQKEFKRVNDQMLEHREEAKSAFYRARLDFEGKELQINQLQAEKTLKELESEQKQRASKLRDIILALSVLLLIILTFYSMRARKTKYKMQRLAGDAEQANRAKSSFLAKMSHEIRTPMNAIIGLSQLTLKAHLGDQQRENISLVHSSSQSLLTLLNDILDFSKIEAQKLTLEHNDFLLENSMTRLSNVCHFSAQEKQLNLNVKIDSDVPKAFIGDTLRLEQILINIVNNAIKFTLQGDISVQVSLINQQKNICTLQFSITDHGIGISQEQMPRLFKSFSQADESITRQFGGSGLGLTISKELVELMGGSIKVTSELGRGSCFTFTVKLALNEQLVPKSHHELTKLTDLRVLIVDDSKSSRILLAELLNDLGLTSLQAFSGIDAFEMVKYAIEIKLPFDVILMDWRMPGLDGFEAIRIIHQAINEPCPQFILISSFDKSEAINLSQQLPIVDILEKPIELSQLTASLLKAVAVSSSAISHNTTQVSKQQNKEHHNKPVRILLAEDNVINQRVILGFLAYETVTIDVVANGLQAIKRLAHASYDIILMDVQMPVMDGLTATRIIRDELKLQTPVVAMTAHSTKKDIGNSLAAGMNIHLTKPIDAKLLISIIEDLVGFKIQENN